MRKFFGAADNPGKTSCPSMEGLQTLGIPLWTSRFSGIVSRTRGLSTCGGRFRREVRVSSNKAGPFRRGFAWRKGSFQRGLTAPKTGFDRKVQQSTRKPKDAERFGQDRTGSPASWRACGLELAGSAGSGACPADLAGWVSETRETSGSGRGHVCMGPLLCSRPAARP